MKFFIYIITILILSLVSIESYADNFDINLLENEVSDNINNNNYDEALIYLDQILKIDPNNLDALNNKGGILIKNGNFSGAIEYFDSILKIDGNNTQALNNKAIALSNQEKYVQALHFFINL